MRPQSYRLFLAQLEYEIERKAIDISFHLLLEALGWNFIQLRKISIEHYFQAANKMDAMLNRLQWN